MAPVRAAFAPATSIIRVLYGCACLGNYVWAAELALALAAEYSFRYGGREHSCQSHALWLALNPPPGISNRERVDFALAMDDSFKISEDPVENYRNYYRTSKQDRGLTTYTIRQRPQWL
jgi:hypothetical protein